MLELLWMECLKNDGETRLFNAKHLCLKTRLKHFKSIERIAKIIIIFKDGFYSHAIKIKKTLSD